MMALFPGTSWTSDRKALWYAEIISTLGLRLIIVSSKNHMIVGLGIPSATQIKVMLSPSRRLLVSPLVILSCAGTKVQGSMKHHVVRYKIILPKFTMSSFLPSI